MYLWAKIIRRDSGRGGVGDEKRLDTKKGPSQNIFLAVGTPTQAHST